MFMDRKARKLNMLFNSKPLFACIPLKIIVFISLRCVRNVSRCSTVYIRLTSLDSNITINIESTCSEEFLEQ